MHRFREAIEAQDLDAALETLSPEVVFNSPVAFQPYVGKETVAQVLRAAFSTFENFSYTDELDSGDGVTALVFRARVGDKDVQGIDLVRSGPDGLIEDFTVLVRPASGLMALGEAMGPKVAGLPQA